MALRAAADAGHKTAQNDDVEVRIERPSDIQGMNNNMRRPALRPVPPVDSAGRRHR